MHRLARPRLLPVQRGEMRAPNAQIGRFARIAYFRRIAQLARRATRRWHEARSHVIRLHCVRLFAFAWFVFGLAGNAHAVFLDEIQVYDGEINDPGEWGLEMHANTTLVGQSKPSFPDQRTAQGGFRLTPEISYGLARGVELGFYLPTIYTDQYGYESAGYKPRVKFMPLQGSQTQPWSLGINFEYSMLNHGMEFPRKGFEARGIIAWKDEHWSLALNPVVDSGRSDGQSSALQRNLQMRAIRLYPGEVITGFGAEYYQGRSAVNSADPTVIPRQAFAVIELKTAHTFLNGMDMHVGLGYGWDSGDRWTIKFIFTPHF